MKKMEADVIVVALGLSGLAAAISAAEQGLSVIGFEKADVTGGRANMGMGPFAVESRLQHENQISLTVEEAYRKHMETAQFECDGKLVYKYYSRSADTIDWLMDMGVRFEVQRYFPHSECTAHNVLPEGGGPTGPRAASTMIKRMTERAEELGVQMLLKTPAKKIIVENGLPVGVVGSTEDGEEIEVRGDVVIMATGGLGTNLEMVKTEYGYDAGSNIQYQPVVGITGEGAKMAWEAGAGKGRLAFEWNYGIQDNFNHFTLEGAFRAKPELIVNISGERFINEDFGDYVSWVGRSLMLQKEKTAFAIIDQERLNYLKKHGPPYVDQVHGTDMYDRFDEVAREAAESDYTGFCIADTIEEMAEKMGIDCEGLKKTLESYNHACDTGRDTELGKSPKYLNPVRMPKFYCCKLVVQTTGPTGGIAINHNTEVLDSKGNVIPGFYAVGLDGATAVFGCFYPMMLPGNNMGYCLNSGRIAGENAAKYIDSLG